jgi:hypothetical protein
LNHATTSRLVAPSSPVVVPTLCQAAAADDADGVAAAMLAEAVEGAVGLTEGTAPGPLEDVGAGEGVGVAVPQPATTIAITPHKICFCMRNLGLTRDP